MGDKEEPEDSHRVIKRRRLISFAVGIVVYAAVLAFVASGSAGTTYTTHTVRYLVLVAVFYTLMSGANAAYGYAKDGTMHEDTPDFAGGIAAVVGLSVFYAEVLGTSAGASTDMSVPVLAFVTVVTVMGMLLILKF